MSHPGPVLQLSPARCCSRTSVQKPSATLETISSGMGLTTEDLVLENSLEASQELNSRVSTEPMV